MKNDSMDFIEYKYRCFNMLSIPEDIILTSKNLEKIVYNILVKVEMINHTLVDSTDKYTKFWDHGATLNTFIPFNPEKGYQIPSIAETK